MSVGNDADFHGAKMSVEMIDQQPGTDNYDALASSGCSSGVSSAGSFSSFWFQSVHEFHRAGKQAGEQPAAQKRIAEELPSLRGQPAVPQSASRRRAIRRGFWCIQDCETD